VPTVADLIIETASQGYDVTITLRLRADGKDGIVTMPNDWLRRLGMSDEKMTELRNERDRTK
jgi:hypothetical protein